MLYSRLLPVLRVHKRMAHVNLKLAGEIRVPVPWGHIAAQEWVNKSLDGESAIEAWRSSQNITRVLGLHGWQDNSGTFDRLAPLLPSNFHFVSVDFPGHGFSSHIPEGWHYNFIDWVSHVHRIVSYLKWNDGTRNFNFIAHSMGAGVAMLYSGTFPDDVDRIIMLDLLKPLGIPDERQPGQTRKAIESLMQSEKTIPRRVGIPMKTAEELLMAAVVGSLTEESARTLLIRGTRRLAGTDDLVEFTRDPRLKLRPLLVLSTDQLKAFASEVKGEILVIRANGQPDYEDSSILEEFKDIYSEKAKRFELVLVDGTHHVHLNSPEVVLSHILQFFSNNSSKM